MEETKLETDKIKLESKINLFSKLAWAAVVVGIIIFLVSGAFIIWGNYTEYKEQLNTIGTFAGGSVASFWSLAGLFFIYVAFLGQKLQLLFQQEELQLQRQELKLTREELEGQRWEMQEQNKTIAIKRFENSFFNLLNNHITITRQLNIHYNNSNIYQGKDIFHFCNDQLKSSLHYNKNKDEELILKKYITVYKSYQSELANYFRNLYTIIDYIDTSKISEEEKYIYVKIIRATLSAFEIVFLFYNCLSDNGKKKFKPLIEKYCLMKNLNSDLLINKNLMNSYDSSAFKRF